MYLWMWSASWHPSQSHKRQQSSQIPTHQVASLIKYRLETQETELKMYKTNVVKNLVNSLNNRIVSGRQLILDSINVHYDCVTTLEKYGENSSVETDMSHKCMHNALTLIDDYFFSNQSDEG